MRGLIVFLGATAIAFPALASISESSEHYSTARRTVECSMNVLMMAKRAAPEQREKVQAAVVDYMAIVRKLGASPGQIESWERAHSQAMRAMAIRPDGADAVWKETESCLSFFDDNVELFARIISDSPAL